MKLLLTSVGSLVGHNILDVLEYPGLSRRSLVQVVGTNSAADAANNFRCDRCYLVPLTVASEYPAQMRDILQKEIPDLILCGRDDDTYALSQLKSLHSELPGALPIGTPNAALIGLDKWQTWLFAQKYGLPFAESFTPGQSGDGSALNAFCKRVGYPLIAKPTRGASSRGVCFIRSAGDAEVVAQRSGYFFQEYLGDPGILDEYFAILSGPPPLFAQFSNAGYTVCQTVIAPSGDLTPITTTENRAEFGRSIVNRRVADGPLDALVRDFARALFLEGGTGPINIQLRQDRHGVWKVFEINLRTSGGTLSRFLRGVDELHLIAKAFVPGVPFPELRPLGAEECTQLVRQYYTHPVRDTDVSALLQTGYWARS